MWRCANIPRMSRLLSEVEEKRMKKSYTGALYLSIAASIWGGMYVVSKYALDLIPPMTLLFARYILASILLGIICHFKQIPLLSLLRSKTSGQRILLWQIGLIGYFLSISAQFWGTKLSSAHMGSLITTLSPIFLSLFAVILLKEKMTPKQMFALVLASLGVVIIIGLPGLTGDQSVVAGSVVLIIAAVSWGYYSAIARKASQIYLPLQMTTLGIWIATACTFPTLLWEWGSWDWKDLFSWPIILSCLYLGIVSTAVAFFSWNKGLSLTPSHQAGLFFFLQPVVGSLLGWLMLDEHLSLSFFIGSILIFSAVYLSMTKKKRDPQITVKQ